VSFRPRILPLLLAAALSVPALRAEEKPAAWWSFRPVVKPALPADDPWCANEIDRFILEGLRAKNLTPSPDAAPAKLARRLSFDLTGLPPTPEAIREFTTDSQKDPETARAKFTDRLLNSPRYGERWAQHWLDIIRWAETVGFETNAERPNAWPYRDWVIESLNADKPYDRFLFEQLAGDTVAQDAALGFLVAGPANLPGQIGRDEEAMRQARQDELDEVIQTVGQAFFGLTIGCARCHDHKFDPITERDYYAMQAIFAGLNYGDRRQRGTENDAWTARIPSVRQEVADLRAKMEALRGNLHLQPALADVQTETFEPLVANAVRMKIAATGNEKEASLYEFEVWSGAENVALASKGATVSASSFALENQTRHPDNLIDGTVDKRQAYPWKAEKSGPAWCQIEFTAPARIERIVWHRGASMPADYEIEARLPDGQWRAIANPRSRMPRVDDTRAAEKVKLTGLTPSQIADVVNLTGSIRKTEAELGKLSSGPQVYAASFQGEPATTWVLHRGDPMQRTGEIAPAVPVSLGNLGLGLNAPEPERRLALAKHLTSPAHPLTARVIVNRVWQHHFGTGLVQTSSDFGKMGALPTHPELLDWLAADFVEHGWSLKRLHRQITESRTFRQDSRPRADALAIDADSRYLWRFPPLRLEAETIRDTILSVSGNLNLQMGGKGFDFFDQRGGLSDYTSLQKFTEEGNRRMIYAHKVRMQAVDIFAAFDCPDAGQMKPARTRSITPIQSLGLFNSPFANTQAALFAGRVREEAGTDAGAQVDRAFELAFSRLPEPAEREKLRSLAEKHGLEQVCRVLCNTSEFILQQ